jgi:hypothetical protein
LETRGNRENLSWKTKKEERKLEVGICEEEKGRGEDR